MRLRDLKHGRDDVASSWPLQFGGALGRDAKFPYGETGKLVGVEAAKLIRGVEVHVEFEGHVWSGAIEWNGERPSVERVIEILRGHIGENLVGLGNIELD